MSYFDVEFLCKMETRRKRTETNTLIQLEIAIKVLAKMWVLRFAMTFSKITSKYLIFDIQMNIYRLYVAISANMVKLVMSEDYENEKCKFLVTNKYDNRTRVLFEVMFKRKK